MRLHHLLPMAAALLIASPATVFAQDDDDDDDDDAPAIMSYGLHGLWTGTGMGLGLGYLTSGATSPWAPASAR